VKYKDFSLRIEKFLKSGLNELRGGYEEIWINIVTTGSGIVLRWLRNTRTEANNPNTYSSPKDKLEKRTELI